MRPEYNFQYVPVDLKTLVIDKTVDFNLFLYHTEQEKFVLFRAQETKFTEENKDTLIKNNVTKLFIELDDYAKFGRYIERHLGDVISSEDLTIDEKTAWVFQCAENILDDTFSNPNSKENIIRTDSFVDNYIHYFSEGGADFNHVRDYLSKDYSLARHGLNVCVYAIAIAHKMGITSRHVLDPLGMGSMVHDIGMTHISEEIRNKKEPLIAEEWAIMRRHPILGMQILERLSIYDKKVLTIVGDHHEKFDGTGYPRQLLKARITDQVRIVTIADIFDALFSSRPYRQAMNLGDAFKTIVKEYKGQIDFDIVRNLVLLFAKKDVL